MARVFRLRLAKHGITPVKGDFMHHLEKTPYGFSLKLAGSLSIDELENILYLELLEQSSGSPIQYQLLLDATELRPVGCEVKKSLEKILAVFISTGLLRCCLLYKSPSIYLQMKNIAAHLNHTGNRYINVLKTSNHKRLSLEWLVFGKEFTTPIGRPCISSRKKLS
jgi:hypothetical protein